MYLAILILPLLGSIISGFLGRKIGIKGSHIITILCLFLASILASIAFYEVGICGSPVLIKLNSWVDSENFNISWEFLFDQLTVSMFLPVIFISTLIHLFSVDYMSSDPHNQRFFSYLSLFTFFMLLLVSGANYLVMFIGWEGIGIVSYLLISFWYTRIQANKSALLALSMNRTGDWLLSISFFALFALFGSLDYSIIFNLTPLFNETAITIIALLLFGGACAKSSQIPLHSWLPGSMEGWLKLIWIKIFIWVIICLFILCFYLLVNDFSNINSYIFIYMSIMPFNLEKNKFEELKNKNKNIIIPDKLKKAIIGDLLGDGHLRYTKKDKEGNTKGNAHFAMTLKDYNYIYYLWKKIYSPICTTTPIRPWPNPKTGQTPKQYAFSSKSLIFLSEIHKQWYIFNKDNKNFIKIVPLNIGELLTPLGLAPWIMGDGYWDNNSKTVLLCTDSFSLSEVELLINILKNKFNLNSTVRRRMKKNNELCWRIRFSGQIDNISKLQSLVKPYLIPCMFYKLNITN